MSFRGFLVLSCVTAVVLSAGETFESLSARASQARLANDIPQAIELYRQALALNNRWEEGWWYVGTLLYDSDQYAAAENALNHFIELDPKAGPAWGLLGLSEFENGHYPPALKHIQQALAAGKTESPQMDAVLRYHEALLLSRTGDFDAALQKYAAFVRSAPPTPPLLLGLGLASLRVPLTPNEVPPEGRELYATAGKAAWLIMAQDYTKASQAFQELLDRFPNAPGVHYLYGCYLFVNAPDHAVTELKHELQIAPSNAAAAGMLAWALLNRGDSTAALPYAKQAVAGAPSFTTAQYVLGRALAETGDPKRGIEHLEIAVKLDPANLENHLALATAYSTAGRTEDARRERARSVDLAMGSQVAHP